MSGGSNYLDGEENLYGLQLPLPDGVAQQASAIVDSNLKRPEGLVYVNDKNGNPSYMKAKVPSFTYKLSALTAGNNVTATVSPPNLRQDFAGEVLVLDRGNPDLMETVVVTGAPSASQVTLQSVQFNHSANVTADIGMTVAEERSVPSKRSIVRYAKFPCVQILSLMGRYAYGRRSDQVGGLYQEQNLLAAVQTFGGPPQWITIPLAQVSWSDETGEIWVPAGLLMAYYSDVKMRYVAGFAKTPDPIVRATAAIAQSLTSAANLYGGNIKTIAAGDSRIERFGGSYGGTNIDADTRRLLEPFKARLFY